ncbi:hypothetical protein SEUCBS139899_006130 [Sporothrix eucalyptigena]|uniref:Carboxymuconolactone decarboxylase n=1 Tax=Sporothrix eucalyptigena TaxID=1812306 RepID=A0ABP0CAA8_9PEZI
MDFQKFLAIYVNTNTAPGAVAYDEAFLLNDLLEGLVRSDEQAFANNIGLQVLFAMCCAMKRADLLPALFASVLRDQDVPTSETATLDLFYRTRETINIIWPFVGVPQIIPAALGLAGYLQSRNVSLKTNRRRPDVNADDVALGKVTRVDIYKASANSEVFSMLDTYHGDLAYALNAVGFGYNMGRASKLGVPLPDAELVLTSALIALNATRQAGSHVKACIGFGYSESSLRAVVDMADKLAQWLGLKMNPMDIGELACQARSNLSTA